MPALPHLSRPFLLLAIAVATASSALADDEGNKEDKKPNLLKPQPYVSGIDWAQPEMVDPGPTDASPPSDAIVLFDGTNLDQWNGDTDKWTLKDGYGITGSRLVTKQPFGDCQLHIEFMSPESESGDEGQQRGNNGVGFMDARYEIQILDSHSSQTYPDGQAAAVYKQVPPMANASRPTGEWQSYDIVFEAPRFNDDGSVKAPASVTVLHNGVLVQNHYELTGTTFYMTPPSYEKHPEKLPLVLYYHNDPVHFRNIWIRDLTGPAGERALESEKKEDAKTADAAS